MLLGLLKYTASAGHPTPAHARGREVKEAEVVVVCHGGGIALVVKDQTKYVAEVGRLIKEGACFAACENTMRDRSLSRDALLPGIVTVPSGAVEVIRKQQQGYGYFKP